MNWPMNYRVIRLFTVVSISAIMVSIVCLVRGVKVPNYGGDEVFFATPLLYMNLDDLSVFQFVYAGPLKTIITAPLFHLFGFSIYTVRLFTISTFLFSLLLWCLYLAKKNYWIALSATLIAASINHDLRFLAKVDINQPTFHNAITICYFVLFVTILESKANWWRSFLFVIMSAIIINNHIRNIWIVNAFLISMLIDFYFYSYRKSDSFARNLRLLISEKWSVFFGWLLSVLYFLFTLRHFAGNPGLEAAKALGNDVSWPNRLLTATSNFAEYSIGGRVFVHAYATDEWGIPVVILGIIFLITSAILFRMLLSSRWHDLWLKRLLLVSMLITVLIFLQYSLTKSAIWPWHGNSLLLFIALSFGLLVQSLFHIKLNGNLPISREHWFSKKKLLTIQTVSTVYLTFTIIVMATINGAASLQRYSSHPIRMSEGFNLAVWNLQALDDIRQYIRDCLKSQLRARRRSITRVMAIRIMASLDDVKPS